MTDTTQARLIEFANRVLETLEADSEWGSDTLGSIADDAVGLGLAESDGTQFTRTGDQ